VLLHSHPFGWDFDESDPHSRGLPFSKQDILMARAADLSETWVVNRGSVFRMARPVNGWPTREDLITAMKHADSVVYGRFKPMYDRGEISGRELDIKHLETFWPIVADVIKARYQQLPYGDYILRGRFFSDEDLPFGGPGSGHYGHAGRPGLRGGSLPADVAVSIEKGRTAEERQKAAAARGKDVLEPEPETGPEKLERVLREQVKTLWEEMESGQDRNETALQYTVNGDLLFSKDGDHDSVMFEPSETGMMTGSVMLHNHPGGWDFEPPHPEASGNTFSKEDVNLLVAFKMRETVVVSREYVFRMKNLPNRALTLDEYQPIHRKYNQAQYDIFWPKINAGEMTPYEANAQHGHIVWTNVAKALGISYERIPYKEFIAGLKLSSEDCHNTGGLLSFYMQGLWNPEDSDLPLGGDGSGHYGHAGRPGKRGGSLPGDVAVSIEKGRTAEERQKAAAAKGASGKLTDELTEALRKTETAFWEAHDKGQKGEQAFAFTKSGKPVFGKVGDANSVSFTDAQKGKLKDTILTHTHPDGWNYEPDNQPYADGRSFSWSDLRFAGEADVAEIRAVSRGYVHRMVRPAGGWPYPEIINEAIETADVAAYKRMGDAMVAGKLEICAGDVVYNHEMSKTYAEIIGAMYERIRHG